MEAQTKSCLTCPFFIDCISHSNENTAVDID